MAVRQMDEPFDPRRAALNHAGMASGIAQGSESATPRVLGELANSIACALVYVGDQLGSVENVSDQLSGVVNLMEQLDVTVNNTLVELARVVEES